ncbi:MAG TPA: malate synthase A, partial [Solirubrobacteraceae bacterium]|nr:malate synthase A [Solirubrobacteraceae bacterium]
MSAAVEGVEVASAPDESLAGILSDEAVAFVAELHRRFEPRRGDLLAARAERDAELRAGGTLAFLDETRDVREDPSWRVPEPPADLRDRRVEITGPTDRKLMINALNSGAKTFMADLEDANTPTWTNVIEGQRNIIDAVERTIAYDSEEDQRHYELEEETATLIVRPRGWHLHDRHVRVDGEPVAAALLDFGLFFFHCAQRL